MILPITLTIAGAAALLNIWLGGRIGRLRVAHKISIGDGGNEALTARMRAQANFIENAPLFLILLGLIEAAVGSPLWLWVVAGVFILGRICHGLGMSRPSPDPLRLRMIGTILTMLILIGLAFYAIALPYFQEAPKPSITYAAR